MSETQIEELIARSNRLGADPRNTNFAGGNTSAKGAATDPVTGEDVELMWVKGSGGDLGTLTAAGLAATMAAMSRPSWKPGRRHGTHATRSPKHCRVSFSPSAAAASAMPESGCR